MSAIRCRGLSWRRTSEICTDIRQFCGKSRKRRIVRGRSRPDHDIHVRQVWQHFSSHNFSQTSLQLVAIDRAVAESRYNDTDPGMSERGSERSDVEVPTPNSLPLSIDKFQVAFARQPKRARKAGAFVRRPRTCSGDAL